MNMDCSLASIFLMDMTSPILPDDLQLLHIPAAWPTPARPTDVIEEEELQRQLVYNSSELQSTLHVTQVQSEQSNLTLLRMQTLLESTRKERDQARLECKKLEKMLLQLSHQQSNQPFSHQAAEQLQASNILVDGVILDHESPLSCITMEDTELPHLSVESNAFNTKPSEEATTDSFYCKPHNPPHNPFSNIQSFPIARFEALPMPAKTMNESHKSNDVVPSPGSSGLMEVMLGALPEKGKLLEAVIEAGPLLETLLLAGPLPKWERPPPQIDAVDIPKGNGMQSSYKSMPLLHHNRSFSTKHSNEYIGLHE
ncbi:hypothetical protein GOP47_0022592 [Adiantum capillus-veneris]|uniref:Uncharacterized protein n=1 Tax=Adiantum capillus-veneris TaxID=13818 RepID=A0A9D4U5V4_ADICA|nr:hypothetical protein GOP47_0022592 [Adiantum capillus-veneris]